MVFSRPCRGRTRPSSSGWSGSPSSRCPGNIAKPRINVGDALMTLFRIAPPINIAGVQETNRAFLQYEYINVLTWADNPRNNGKNVVAYRIYKVNGAQETLLAEVPVSTHVYWDRAAARRTNVTYSFSAIGGDGEESPRYLYTLGF